MFTFTYIMGFIISALMVNHWAMSKLHLFNPEQNGHIYKWDPGTLEFWLCATVLWLFWWALPFLALFFATGTFMVAIWEDYSNLHKSVAHLMQNR